MRKLQKKYKAYYLKFKNLNFWQEYKAYFLISLAVVIVYSPSLFFDYSYFDDHQLIIRNSNILASFNLKLFFSSDVFFSDANYYYRPLLNISLALDYFIGGLKPFIYHLTNLILHLLVSFLLYHSLILSKIKKDQSILFSLIFAIHPVFSQAVSWIPGRNDSLLALFSLLAIIFWAKFLKKERLSYFIFFNLSFLLALLSKETAVLLPLFAFFWGFLFFKKDFKARKAFLGALSVLFILTTYFILRSLAIGGMPGMGAMFSRESFLAPFIFLAKFFLPINLTVYPVFHDTNIIYTFLLSLLLLIYLYLSRPLDYKKLILAGSWLYLSLFLGSFRPDAQEYSFLDHRLYSLALAIFLIISELKNPFLSLSKHRKIVLSSFLLICLAVFNISYSQNFKNSLSFWSKAVADSPSSSLSLNSLGAIYYLEGELERAEEIYKRVLDLNENEKFVHNNLGLIYLDKGLIEEAKMEFEMELALHPTETQAYYNLALLNFKQGEMGLARHYLNKVLSINPLHSEAQEILNILNDY